MQLIRVWSSQRHAHIQFNILNKQRQAEDRGQRSCSCFKANQAAGSQVKLDTSARLAYERTRVAYGRTVM
jgi:hypothetical protein